MEYRRAKLGEIEELVKARLAYLEAEYKEMTEEQAKKIRSSLPSYYEKHLNQDFFAYLGVDGDEVVSSVFLLVMERPANPSFITGKVGTILNVYTQPDYRRRGIALELMSMAVEDGRNMELSYLELEATSDGKPLYEKVGFVKKKSEFTSMRYNY